MLQLKTQVAHLQQSLPPHDLVLESYVLGAFLLEKPALIDRIEWVDQNLFYFTAHQHIAHAMLSLYAASL